MATFGLDNTSTARLKTCKWALIYEHGLKTHDKKVIGMYWHLHICDKYQNRYWFMFVLPEITLRISEMTLFTAVRIINKVNKIKMTTRKRRYLTIV